MLSLATWARFSLTLFRILFLTHFRSKKAPPPTSFFHVTSTNVGISPQNFLTFSFNSFATLVKSWFFWSNPDKIKVMITSLIVILESPNVGQMTTFTILFESRDKVLLVKPWTEIMTSSPLYQNVFILRSPKVANFADGD